MAVTRTGRPTRVDGGTASQVLSAALAWLAAHTEWFGPRWDDHFPPRDFDGATVNAPALPAVNVALAAGLVAVSAVSAPEPVSGTPATDPARNRLDAVVL